MIQVIPQWKSSVPHSSEATTIRCHKKQDYNNHIFLLETMGVKRSSNSLPCFLPWQHNINKQWAETWGPDRKWQDFSHIYSFPTPYFLSSISTLSSWKCLCRPEHSIVPSSRRQNPTAHDAGRLGLFPTVIPVFFPSNPVHQQTRLLPHYEQNTQPATVSDLWFSKTFFSCNT